MANFEDVQNDSDGMTKFKELGNEAYQAGDYEKAVQHYTEGIENEPGNAILFSNRSAAYLNLRKFDKAKLDARNCVRLDPLWSKGWWRLGTALLENEEYKSARATFNEGLTHCRDDANLLKGLEKANACLSAIESVSGGGEAGNDFNLDGASERQPVHIAEGKDLGAESGTLPKHGVDETTKGITTEDPEMTKVEEEAWPGTAEEEIKRITKAPNHYAVLHVKSGAGNDELKRNYYKLARILHPDRCQLRDAGDAMTAVSQAYDTLSNKLKKTLYDQFLTQTGGESERPNQTYQEWESQQEPMELPKWLLFLLGIKGCGYVLVILICIIVLPLFILILIVFALFQILLLPVYLFLKIFFPERYAILREKHARKIAKWEEEEQDRMFAHIRQTKCWAAKVAFRAQNSNAETVAGATDGISTHFQY